MNPAEEYINNKPEPYRAVMLHLQFLIESNFPEMQLKYKWHMPFYYLDDKTMFCFFNFRKTFVDLGLSYGDRLSNQHGVLIAGEGRKMLRSLRFKNLEDINDSIIIETLQELIVIRKSMKNK